MRSEIKNINFRLSRELRRADAHAVVNLDLDLVFCHIVINKSNRANMRLFLRSIKHTTRRTISLNSERMWKIVKNVCGACSRNTYGFSPKRRLISDANRFLTRQRSSEAWVCVMSSNVAISLIDRPSKYFSCRTR